MKMTGFKIEAFFHRVVLEKVYLKYLIVYIYRFIFSETFTMEFGFYDGNLSSKINQNPWKS